MSSLEGGRVPLLEVEGLARSFGKVAALEDVSMNVHAGEVMCVLGDNGAGKSTLIKTLSGVHLPDRGIMRIAGEEVRLKSPREARDRGIATVYQDLAMVPMLSIVRNFFLGAEPMKGVWPFRWFDLGAADAVVRTELEKMGIRVRNTSEAVGTLSGGERQSIAIARAVYFGARVLILDEPTSALGVKQAGIVLRYVAQARARGCGVILVTHNPHHAWLIGDRFTILNRGRSQGTFSKDQITREELIQRMAGGRELEELTHELGEFKRETTARVAVSS
ncbi:monosaccharide ABC transporter ATP-binding protein, CUT2 family [Stigmatella aurantiaca]|uniref:Monosaccharide ABC transporter ATP-binding protein, CUT2 family n=1 Tax=Stigmatella aurantiaca TaxID=41 RepID=A0A1H7MMQ7_STIAU|nr:ATP-binding cassette domain-containing protein [Stigmatella aurantiaca]SEL12148.1 monosaccharide ABC transporter ATP-binding protein, CUT2 family [Stigmatella aurantiaca]